RVDCARSRRRTECARAVAQRLRRCTGAVSRGARGAPDADRTNAMKRTLILCVCLMLTGCRGKKEEAASPVVTVGVAPVLLSQIQQTVRADGVLYPKQQAAIVPKAAAPIKKALVQRGAKVKAGQLLVELENQDLAGAATESRATYDQAQATYETTAN